MALYSEVVDVRIKQINLLTDSFLRRFIVNRMRAEREAVARRHRSRQKKRKPARVADYETAKPGGSRASGRIMRVKNRC